MNAERRFQSERDQRQVSVRLQEEAVYTIVPIRMTDHV
jgi:hypothetical protein